MIHQLLTNMASFLRSMTSKYGPVRRVEEVSFDQLEEWDSGVLRDTIGNLIRAELDTDFTFEQLSQSAVWDEKIYSHVGYIRGLVATIECNVSNKLGFTLCNGQHNGVVRKCTTCGGEK